MDEDHILVDFDQTLNYYEKGDYKKNNGKIFYNPVFPLVNKVQDALDKGTRVKIFTARAADRVPEQMEAIRRFCRILFGQELEIVNYKNGHTKEIWDDIARQVIPNTGKFVGE